MTITTFVGQNIGAKEYKRVKKGIFTSWLMCSGIILVGSCHHVPEGSVHHRYFTEDAAVISVGSSMIRIFGSAYLFLPIIQILNGALRGAGRSKVPMYFMLGCFVLLRQIYLMIAVPMTKMFPLFCRMACDLGGLRHRNAGLLF